MGNDIRIDKWLWSMRLFKTRSLAAEACKKGQISSKGKTLKPSHTVQVGDVIAVRRAPIIYSFRILALTPNRLGAKLVPEYMENVTAPDQMEMLRLAQLAGQLGRARGTGRPTKKERRDLEEFIDTDTPPDWLVAFDDDDDDDDENLDEL